MKLLLFALINVWCPVMVMLVQAYPQLEPCTVSNWLIGNNFGTMGLLKAGSASICSVSGLPASYNPCQSYTISVSSQASLGHKIWAGAGVWTAGPTLQNSCSHTSFATQTLSTYTWKAPAGVLTSVEFKSLCGTAGSLFLGSATLIRNTAAPTFGDSCDATNAPSSSSPTTLAPTSQAPSLSPTAAPTLPPPIGVDGLAPAANNWRNAAGGIVYKDLRINPGGRVQFLWNGQHSVVQYKNQKDFDACNITSATFLAPLTLGGSFLLDALTGPGTMWISCGVPAHCQQGQKVRIFTELAPISPSGESPPPLQNWKNQPYFPLTVTRGQIINFQWEETTHSIVQFSNQLDFDACDLSKATQVVGPISGANYSFLASKVGNFWLGCSVGSHCKSGQKLKIIVTPPSVGPDGLAATSNSWKIQNYTDLTIPKGTELRFDWLGSHSLLLVPSQQQFDGCSLTGSKILVGRTSPGTFTYSTKQAAVGDVSLFACGVETHCSSGQKVAVTVGRTSIGPDGIFPLQRANWRQKAYPDLRVVNGTDVTFLWDGTSPQHSIIQFSNQADWEACNIGAGTVLAPASTNGSLTLSFDELNSTTWLACGFGAHCATFQQKIRIFVEADALAVPTTVPTSAPGDGASGAGAPSAASSSNTGAILGGLSGVLVAAAVVAYRQRKRSRSMDESMLMSKGSPTTEMSPRRFDGPTTNNEHDVEAQDSSEGHKRMTIAPDFWGSQTATSPASLPAVPSRTSTTASTASTLSTRQAPSTAGAGRIEKPARVAGLDPLDEISEEPSLPQAKKQEEDETFGKTVANKVGTLTRAARAQAGTLKKSFQEKREIAMRSFRPIVALDAPLPPPPSSPPPMDSASSKKSVFKPHSMYGPVSIKLPGLSGETSGVLSRLPEENKDHGSAQVTDSVQTKPGNSSTSSQSQGSTAPGRVIASVVTSGPAPKGRQFAPSANELSSPDNFKDVAAKIKQSVKSKPVEYHERVNEQPKEKSKPSRRTTGAAAESSSRASLVVLQAEGGGSESSSNPLFQTGIEETPENDSDVEESPVDTNGVAKPYGALRNHPLYNRTLSV